MAVRPLFDIEEWRKNQTGNFIARQYALIQAMARAEPDLRPQARLDLARFYMARAMYPEAKGVTEVAMADPNAKKDESIALMVHAVASILIGRPGRGLKDLANPAIGANYDSQMWQALALARQAKWAEAREKFKNVEFAIASLPVDLQRIVTIGCHARRARGQGLCRGRQAPRRARRHRRAGGTCSRRPRCCAAGLPKRWGTTTTRSTNTGALSPPTTASRRPRRSCSRSLSSRSATRSSRRTCCASWKCCR